MSYLLHILLAMNFQFGAGWMEKYKKIGIVLPKDTSVLL